jgi:DNA repair exonuclease SbcCD nuclease subunit
MTKLNNGAFWTDIHWGKKNNSQQHNEDCLAYITWFCEQVKADPSINYLSFLGDWFENRSAINISTLNYSYRGAKMINDLGLPVYFVVGNHDLYHRHTREIHSIVPFHEFNNFSVIDQPTVVSDIQGGAFFSPYLFHDEYPDLSKYLDIPFWAGHFEFKGFNITGYNVKMPTGPDHKSYAGPKHILSGHYHQRQQEDNVNYIGNCFPMDFGDANDFNRGMAKYNHTTQSLNFTDWNDCPKYVRVKLSQMLNPDYVLPKNARVKCLVDQELGFENTMLVRDQYIETYSLRELTFEESSSISEAITDTQSSVETENVTVELDDINTVDQLVLQMLGDIKNDKVDTGVLIEIYKSLK